MTVEIMAKGLQLCKNLVKNEKQNFVNKIIVKEKYENLGTQSTVSG